MICENCRENEVNFKYTEVINGKKREIALCNNCAKKLGLQNLDFEKTFAEAFNTQHSNLFNNLFSFSNSNNINELFNIAYRNDFFDFAENILPDFNNTRTKKANYFDEFDNDLINIFFNNLENKGQKEEKNTIYSSSLSKQEKQDVLNDIAKAINKKEKIKSDSQTKNKENKIQKLQVELEKAIKEERYEDAAKLRDEINKLK